MKSFQRLSPALWIVFAHLCLMAVAGIFVVGSLLVEPSQGGGFLGYSTGRWIILLVNFLVLAGVLFATYRVWNNRTGKLEAWLSNNRNLFRLFFLSLILFGISLPAALGWIPAIRYFAYFGRLQPSLIWLALVSGQVWLTLLFLLWKPILDWFRQFFPFDGKEPEPLPLVKTQQVLMLGIALVYFALQWGSHIQVGEAFWLPDSIDYIFPAETYAWNEFGLWAHTKPWGTAVLYKLAGSSPVTIDAAQTILSALAWLGLAWVFGKVIHRPWLRVTAFGLILGFSLAPSVQMWNHIIQSESLSILLMVLIIAVWLSLMQRWRWEKLFALIFLFGWWIGTRETNIYLSLMAAGILVLVGLFYKRQRFYWAVSVLLIFFGYINMQISEVPTIPRWLYPLTNTVLHRILPNEEFLSFFEAKGMPVPPELMALSGGFANTENFAVFNNPALDDVERWLYKRGKEVYVRFLIRHPVYTLTDPWIHVHEMLQPKGLFSYAPEQYRPVLGWLFGALIYPNSIWLVLFLALATVATTLIAKPWRDSRAFWLILGMLALFFPHFYLVWHGDAAEVGRHAIQASVQLRLSLWLLLVLAFDSARMAK